MAAPFGAVFLHWIGRRALRWFYRDVHYLGAERIPKTGPVLLIGNHPNDLPDVIAGMFATERHVRFVATLSATTLPLAAASYRSMGVIPVTRVRDVRKMRALGIDVGAVNAAAFTAVRQAFAGGDVVAIFPEGGVHDTPLLGYPRSGVSKMALLGLDSGLKSEVIIVPFGVQYEAPRTLRSDVIVHIGEPISLERWLASWQASGRASGAMLGSRETEAALSVSTDWSQAEARDRLTAIIAATTAGVDEPLAAVAARLQARCAAIVADADRDWVSSPWQSDVEAIGDAVVRAGGLRTSARDAVRLLQASSSASAQEGRRPATDATKVHAQWPSVAWLVVAAAPALVGLLLHAPLWSLVLYVAKRLTVVRTDYVAKAILPGLHLIFLGYLVLGGLFALGAGAAGLSTWWVPALSVSLLMVLPSLGDLGLSWRDAIRATRFRARVRRWSTSDRAAIVAAADRLRAAWNARH